MQTMPHLQEFSAILAARLSRRTVLAGGAATLGLAACARKPVQEPSGEARVAAASAFGNVAPRHDDTLAIAAGYRSNLVARWGDSLVTGTADFDTRRLANADWVTPAAIDAQHRQFGTNCDAVQYF